MQLAVVDTTIEGYLPSAELLSPNMMLTGFPVCPENAKPDIVFLTGRAVETFDDSELEALLKKNLIINHDALAPLAKRGINLGVRALPKAGGITIANLALPLLK